MSALAWLAAILCATGIGALLAGNINLVFAASLPHYGGLFQQYNAGALFTPALFAAFVCAITAIWPRRLAPAPAARAIR